MAKLDKGGRRCARSKAGRRGFHHLSPPLGCAGPFSVMVHAATSAGVEAEEIAETKLHRIQGSALRWPFLLAVLSQHGLALTFPS